MRVGGVETPLEVTLVADGKAVSRERIQADGDVRLDYAGGARWMRAEVYARGVKGVLALTNPTFSARP